MKDSNSNQRVLEILRLIIERPAHYTAQMLAKNYGINVKTIQNYINDIENAGFLPDRDQQHRYFIVHEKISQQLEDIMVLSQTEKEQLYEALHHSSLEEKHKKRIIGKLENLSQLPGVGNTFFNHHFLANLSSLNIAQKNETRVILKDYRSTNSNSLKDRLIEPFHLAVEDDILHAFDCEKKAVRHFRLSRIDKIEALDKPWEYRSSHYVAATDIFRITNKNQETVHIRMKVGGANELIERYPLSKAYLHQNSDNTYDLKCKVNENFYGLGNFLMGYAPYIEEIIESPALVRHMKKLKDELFF